MAENGTGEHDTSFDYVSSILDVHTNAIWVECHKKTVELDAKVEHQQEEFFAALTTKLATLGVDKREDMKLFISESIKTMFLEYHEQFNKELSEAVSKRVLQKMKALLKAEIIEQFNEQYTAFKPSAEEWMSTEIAKIKGQELTHYNNLEGIVQKMLTDVNDKEVDRDNELKDLKDRMVSAEKRTNSFQERLHFGVVLSIVSWVHQMRFFRF
jgi:hypothetical protein